MSNLDKYREEAKQVHPDPAYPENDAHPIQYGLYQDKCILQELKRKAHIAARLLSEQFVAEVYKEAYTCGYNSTFVDGNWAKVMTEYLSTHTPPLLDIRKLIDEAWEAALNNEMVYRTTAMMLAKYKGAKQQYIDEKLKSL